MALRLQSRASSTVELLLEHAEPCAASERRRKESELMRPRQKRGAQRQLANVVTEDDAREKLSRQRRAQVATARDVLRLLAKTRKRR